MTLIEVVVVVAIIALLLAILVPSLAKSREQAKRVACASHLRAFGNCLSFYRSGLGRYPDIDDRNPHSVTGQRIHVSPDDPLRIGSSRIDALDYIGDQLGEALMISSLGDPWALYCPSAALNPYAKKKNKGVIVQMWQWGQISYMYLSGLRAIDDFKDANGQATFNPSTESADRRLNRVNPHAVLAGDRTVQLVPGQKPFALPGSNHRDGGWFYFTSGEMKWWPQSSLTPHPNSAIKWYWYWPKVAN